MWENEVVRLAESIKGWAAKEGMAVEQYAAEPAEPLLEITRAGTRFYLEPAEFSGRDLPASLWFYSYPLLRRVQIVGPTEGDWILLTEDGVLMDQTLTEDTFGDLLLRLSS